MKTKTKCRLELFLYNLLWLGEDWLCPSYRHLGESFEGWGYRHGLLRRIHNLEAGNYLEESESEEEMIGRFRRRLLA